MSDDLLRQRLRLRQMQMRAQQTQAPAPSQQQAAAPQEAPQTQEAGQSPSAWSDVPAALGAGVLRGAAGLADVPGAIMGAGASLGAAAARGLGFGSPESEQSAQQVMQMAAPMQSGQLRERVAEDTGGYSEFLGETTPGRYAGTVGEFLPGAAAFGGGSAANLVRYGVVPGVASEAAGQATEGTASEPFARAAAAVAAPLAAGGIATAARRAVSPLGGRIDPARRGAIDFLEQRGIDLTAGQRTGSQALARREGFAGQTRQVFDRQQEQFTAAAMRTAGSQQTRATPEALRETADNIGQMFEQSLRGVSIRATPALEGRLQAVATEYALQAPSAARTPRVDSMLDMVRTARQNNLPLDGRDVAMWRSALGRLSTSSDAATREAATSAIRVIDTATTGALRSAGRRADVQTLQQAREYWRNFLAIQQAATRAGAESGVLTPAALRGVVAQQGRSAYAQGRRGELGELVRYAAQVMRQPPTSGTAENLRALGAPTGIAASAGAAVGSSMGPGGAAIGAMVGGATPGLLRAAQATRPGQAYMANQMVGAGQPVFGRGLTGPSLNALSQMLSEQQ